MLEIDFIKNNPERVKKAMTDKGLDEVELVDQVIEADRNWRELVQKVEQLRSESNKKARKIGGLMKEGKKEEAQQLIDENTSLKEQIQDKETNLKNHKQRRDQLLLQIPNIADDSVPVGKDENDNEVVHSSGDPLDKEWRIPHWELEGFDGAIEFERGSKVSGAGYPFYTGRIAKLQRALISYFLTRAEENGYYEVQPPLFVNEDSARGTGQLPDKEDMMYVIPRDELYAIPTAEVPVTNYHRDEILNQEHLPLKYSSYTPCWRREAGSHGTEVRGLNRLHQFDKVELVKLVHPDHSEEELESLRKDAEKLLEELKLPYRTLLMCTGDMGFTQAKKYDIEVWSPGQEKWLEVSSCSNFRAYQARRLQIRYRGTDGDTHFVHTLNGSGLALPRVLAAILEHYQLEEGTVAIPDVLKSYLAGENL